MFLRIPADLVRRLSPLALREDLSMVALCVRLLREGLDRAELCEAEVALRAQAADAVEASLRTLAEIATLRDEKRQAGDV